MSLLSKYFENRARVRHQKELRGKIRDAILQGGPADITSLLAQADDRKSLLSCTIYDGRCTQTVHDYFLETALANKRENALDIFRTIFALQPDPNHSLKQWGEMWDITAPLATQAISGGQKDIALFLVSHDNLDLDQIGHWSFIGNFSSEETKTEKLLDIARKTPGMESVVKVLAEKSLRRLGYEAGRSADRELDLIDSAMNLNV